MNWKYSKVDLDVKLSFESINVIFSNVNWYVTIPKFEKYVSLAVKQCIHNIFHSRSFIFRTFSMTCP